MAYIGVGSEGSRLVGPLGLKKAEQDLIKRRYNQHNYQITTQSQSDLTRPLINNSSSALGQQVLAVGG